MFDTQQSDAHTLKDDKEFTAHFAGSVQSFIKMTIDEFLPIPDTTADGADPRTAEEKANAQDQLKKLKFYLDGDFHQVFPDDCPVLGRLFRDPLNPGNDRIAAKLAENPVQGKQFVREAILTALFTHVVRYKNRFPDSPLPEGLDNPWLVQTLKNIPDLAKKAGDIFQDDEAKTEAQRKAEASREIDAREAQDREYATSLQRELNNMFVFSDRPFNSFAGRHPSTPSIGQRSGIDLSQPELSRALGTQVTVTRIPPSALPSAIVSNFSNITDSFHIKWHDHTGTNIYSFKDAKTGTRYDVGSFNSKEEIDRTVAYLKISHQSRVFRTDLMYINASRSISPELKQYLYTELIAKGVPTANNPLGDRPRPSMTTVSSPNPMATQPTPTASRSIPDEEPTYSAYNVAPATLPAPASTPGLVR
ncbi:hypothetical protein BH10PSE19_BH10PSE19_13090 [soil metagenome]